MCFFFDVGSGATYNDVPHSDPRFDGALLACHRGKSSPGDNNVRLLLRPTS